MPAYSTDKGFTGSNKEKPTGNSKSGGGGGGAGRASYQAYTQPRDPAGPAGNISGGSGTGPGGKSYTSRAERGEGPGGGTTTRWNYTPGAVPNYPNANTAQVIGTLIGAAPVAGLLNSIPDVVEGFQNPKAPPRGGAFGRLLSADPGLQEGWQPDRYRGQASLGGIGGSGGAVNSGEREIPGRSIRAEANSLADDQVSETPESPLATDLYSDVMLKDRRKPYPALKQMLEAML